MMYEMRLKTLCTTVVWTPSVSLLMAWKQSFLCITLVAIVNLGDIACYRERSLHRQGMLRLNQRSIEAHSDYEIISANSGIDDRGPRYQNTSHQMNAPRLQTRRGIDAETMSTRRVLSVQAIPEECRKTGVCETVPDYPEAAVESVLKQLGDKADKVFTIDELLAPTFTQRNGGAPEETELCAYREKIIYPQAAKSKEGKWYYILNRREKPLQGFRVEICSETSSCNTNVVIIPSFYESTCKQKHILRNMAALDDNNRLIEKNFLIPSCCSCVVTASSDF